MKKNKKLACYEPQNITLLDCTLRDGGYYNAWDFDREIVESYLGAMADSGVSIVEIGFRSLPNGSFRGAHAFSTDDYIDSLKYSSDLCLAVMVNAADLVKYAEGPSEAILKLFSPSHESLVSLVRIASHFRELEGLEPAIATLKSLGYDVGLNLMQAGVRSDAELSDTAMFALRSHVDLLYFADSLGNMVQSDVTRVINAFRQDWDGPIGVHTHDNMLRALDNSIGAIDQGATWIDSTVLGMGRGPGNARTEHLMLELGCRFKSEFNILPILDLLRSKFEPLQKKFLWGPHPLYHIAAESSVHPTYVQNMLSDTRYRLEDIVLAMDLLKDGVGQSYSDETLADALQIYKTRQAESTDVSDLAKDRAVLIVAAGPGAERHKEGLCRFIKNVNPLVVALNLHNPIDQEYIDIWAVCHPTRLLMELGSYEGKRQPLLLPRSSLPPNVTERVKDTEVLDYGLVAGRSKFEFYRDGCAVPKPLVACYAIAFATSANANQIYLAGFDGFSGDDPRQHEMVDAIRSYQASDGSLPLTAITPTSYPVSQRSVYSFT